MAGKAEVLSSTEGSPARAGGYNKERRGHGVCLVNSALPARDINLVVRNKANGPCRGRL